MDRRSFSRGANLISGKEEKPVERDAWRAGRRVQAACPTGRRQCRCRRGRRKRDAALQLREDAARATVSRDTPNKGRAYFHCAERRCGFFAWADGEQRERIGRR